MSSKTVLVTGSSRGIGKAIALKFAAEGYNVIINCIKNESKLSTVQQEIESLGASCVSFVGDMGVYESAQALFTIAKEKFGNIDIVINNAGISYVGLFQDTTPEMWDKMLRTNLSSVYNTCHLAVPDMLDNKEGKIVNISSVWGVTGASCEVMYSATKGAINAFTKALAKELAPSNIQVNTIALGAIDTEMNYFLTDEELMSLTDEIPTGRLGTAEEVADLVYNVATKHSYLTGQTIIFDGGWI